MSATVTQQATLERLLMSSTDRAPDELMPELLRFADSVGDDACEALLAANPEMFRHTPALAKAYCQWMVDDDMAEAARLLQGERLVHRPKGDLFQAVDFANCKRMVMVGCGASPSTVFQICDKTDVPEIVALDVLPDAIRMVRALSSQLGISRVRAEVGSGQDFDFAGADVIIVANLVSPKAAVLSRIADTAPAAVQIVSRDPYSLATLWTERAESNLDPRLKVVGRGIGSHLRTRDIYIRRRAVT
jgi:hypothetical protein